MTKSTERMNCVQLYNLREFHGLSTTECARLAGVTIDKASRWLGNPSKYDPFIDEIAVTRALEGERSVWDALTIWERDVVFEKLEKVRTRLFDFEWNEYVENLRRKLECPVWVINRGMRQRRT